jgi:SAM-dependent methyltransferase
MAGQPRWQQVGGDAADVYERHLVPAMFAPWAPLLLEAADVRRGERVLDVACGTGVVARLAAPRIGDAGRVVGLDVNAAMLAVARSLPPAAGAAIEWCEASALAMPLPDAAFDVVLCQQGLQQFPDRLAALGEMHRVLRSPGRLAACVWGRIDGSPGMAALVEALERHVSLAAANNRRAPFALGDADGLRSLVDHAGFHDVSVRTMTGTARFPSPDKLVEYQLAATPLSTLGGMHDEAFAAVARDVSAALQAYVTEDGLALPMEVNLVVARK